MTDELVLDASVAVKCFLTEDGSEAARELVLTDVRLIAPDFIYAELASVAVKRARQGDIDRSFADEIIDAVPSLFDETFPVQPLVSRAQALAFDHGISVYDALYVALAEARDAVLSTADVKLIRALNNTPHASRLSLLTQ